MPLLDSPLATRVGADVAIVVEIAVLDIQETGARFVGDEMIAEVASNACWHSLNGPDLIIARFAGRSGNHDVSGIGRVVRGGHNHDGLVAAVHDEILSVRYRTVCNIFTCGDVNGGLGIGLSHLVAGSARDLTGVETSGTIAVVEDIAVLTNQFERVGVGLAFTGAEEGIDRTVWKSIDATGCPGATTFAIAQATATTGRLAITATCHTLVTPPDAVLQAVLDSYESLHRVVKLVGCGDFTVSTHRLEEFGVVVK